jgi:hypothetical protein
MKHNDHLHVVTEFVVVLVVREEDISLTKTHTKSNIINYNLHAIANSLQLPYKLQVQ